MSKFNKQRSRKITNAKDYSSNDDGYCSKYDGPQTPYERWMAQKEKEERGRIYRERQAETARRLEVREHKFSRLFNDNINSSYYVDGREVSYGEYERTHNRIWGNPFYTQLD